MKKIYIGIILIFIVLMLATCSSKKDPYNPGADADDNPIGTDPTRPNDLRVIRNSRYFEDFIQTDTIK